MTLELKLIGKKGNGMVCLVEKDAPTIYQLKPDETSDGVFELEDDLVHSIVLDGLYTEGRQRKRINLPYRRRGRNIEVIVADPYHVKEFKGLNFHVVTFKGAGAIPEDNIHDERYLIDPFTWRGGSRYSQLDRIWGGVFEDDKSVVWEVKNKLLLDRNILHTPYVAQNRIPEEVQNEIYKNASPIIYGSTWDKKIHFREKQDSDPDLYQVVRLSMTNIRQFEFESFSDYEMKRFAKISLEAGWTLEKWIEHLGNRTGILTAECLKLASKGKFLTFGDASFDDNTYITGEITDLEQVVIENYEYDLDYHSWPTNMMRNQHIFIRDLSAAMKENSSAVVDAYFRRVSKISKHEFSLSHFNSQYHDYRIQQKEKPARRKVRI